jgi:ubiquinone/menaquinone biosynthesis C-methylase UbiE
MESELKQLEKQWNEQAEDWNQYIGDEGDSNRRETSDSYLWKHIGNVDDKVVLDAGCGNGYLTIKLALETQAKRIIGVDLSSNMVQIAKGNVNRRITRDEVHQKVEVHHDSVTELKTIEDNSIDLIISNYVLMDTPDLDSVLKVTGIYQLIHSFNIYFQI